MKQFLVERFKNGDTTADSGKIVSEFHYNRLCDLLNPEDLGPDHKFAFGNPNAFKDRYLKPCLIQNVRKEAQVLQEEIFGPIFPMITYKHIDEAIDYINNEQEKPLVVYFMGPRGSATQMKVEQLTSSGSFVTNECILQVVNIDLPFGGVGYSGNGRTHGFVGFKNFSNMKSVLKKPALDCFPFNRLYPPYDAKTQEIILSSLNNGVVTQQMLCNKLIRMVIFIILVVFAVIYRAELGELFNILFIDAPK